MTIKLYLKIWLLAVAGYMLYVVVRDYRRVEERAHAYQVVKNGGQTK